MGLIIVDWSGNTQPEDYDKLIFEVNTEGEKISVLYSGNYTTVFDLGECQVPQAFDLFKHTLYENKAELMAELEIEDEDEIEDALDWHDKLMGCRIEAEDDDEFQRNLDSLLLD